MKQNDALALSSRKTLLDTTAKMCEPNRDGAALDVLNEKEGEGFHDNID